MYGIITDKYNTILESCSNEIKIQKSRFISDVFHLDNEKNSSFYLSVIKKKYYDAKHHPYAYRKGRDKNDFRHNDDGEPPGSSGKPVLDAIDKYELTDVIIIVTRYFGGIKLGVGGLKRAYSEAAEECIKKSKISVMYVCEKYSLTFDYIFINHVMRYIEKNKIKILQNNPDAKVNLLCELRISDVRKFKGDILNLTNGSAVINKLSQ